MDFHPQRSLQPYLIARLSAQIEILRQQALYVSISEDQRGRWLQQFLVCMESRGVRLIDRISQLAVGETLIADLGTVTIRYIDFIKSVETSDTSRWLTRLVTLLRKATHTTERQHLLQYAVVIHAMIDTLDPSHSVTRDRPAVPGKLTKQTWRNLKYRVFGTYLAFVADVEKYIGRPKSWAADRGRWCEEGFLSLWFLTAGRYAGGYSGQNRPGRLLNHPYSVATRRWRIL